MKGILHRIEVDLQETHLRGLLKWELEAWMSMDAWLRVWR